jgi:outer membrane murein-binding lipoprotein Lpp
VCRPQPTVFEIDKGKNAIATENIESLVLEHLRPIRGKIDQISGDMDDLKARMSSLESSMVSVKREVNHGDEVDARHQVTLDRLAKRLEKIEIRLELA